MAILFGKQPVQPGAANRQQPSAGVPGVQGDPNMPPEMAWWLTRQRAI